MPSEFGSAAAVSFATIELIHIYVGRDFLREPVDHWSSEVPLLSFGGALRHIRETKKVVWYRSRRQFELKKTY